MFLEDKSGFFENLLDFEKRAKLVLTKEINSSTSSLTKLTNSQTGNKKEPLKPLLIKTFKEKWGGRASSKAFGGSPQKA